MYIHVYIKHGITISWSPPRVDPASSQTVVFAVLAFGDFRGVALKTIQLRTYKQHTDTTSAGSPFFLQDITPWN